MSKHLVICAFVDKDSLQGFSVGDVFESTNEDRINHLKEKGFLKVEIKEEEGIKHLGGGYYELPNGEKIKGKENALKAFEELDKTPDDE